MKTELTISTTVSRAAKQLARQMGMTLDEFFATAVTAYVVAHQKKLITESLNQIFTDESSSLDPVVAKLQAMSLGDAPW
jgi:hypothetical protein